MSFFNLNFLLISLLALNFIPAMPIRLILSALVCLTVIIYHILLSHKSNQVKQSLDEFLPQSAVSGTDKSVFGQNTYVESPKTDMDYKINELVISLKGKTPVLPVLSEQLNSVIQLTDDAAMQIIMSFQKINKQAKKLLTDMYSGPHSQDK